MSDRRGFLELGFGCCLFLSLSAPVSSAAAGFPKVMAFRNPGCECCEGWAKHLEAAGFGVTMTDDPELDARRKRLGMPEALAGCHLAEVGPYVIDGHVPAEDIIRLLQEQPNALGLALPGMPIGSPGMEAGTPELYVVYIVSADGSSKEFSRH